MKRTLSLFLLSAVLAAPAMNAQTADSPIPAIPTEIPANAAGQAASAVEAARAVAPEAVKKAEQKVGEVSSQLAPAGTAKKGATKSATRNATDPAGWGPNETHKLAVMEVKIGRETSTVMFELFPSEAPKTVANFAANADSNLYNGLAVHRAIDSYLVQTGDPLTANEDARDKWGTGGQDRLPAEIKRSHKLGAVAMARRGDKVNPDRKSNDSQFYFVLGNMTGLDGQYTVFGQVVDGLDVLESISRVPTDSNECPLDRIEIKSLRVVDHKGPLVVTRTVGGQRKVTKPMAAKGPFERFLERVW
jgi:cyclophilin family peptidyl-prolyl cis-trans isomerase